MAYVTPKTDWKGFHTDTQEYDPTADVIGANDFNRIEGNILSLKDGTQPVAEADHASTATLADAATTATTATNATNADKLDSKHWVTVDDSSISIGANLDGFVNLRAGGAHHFYLASVYSDNVSLSEGGDSSSCYYLVIHGYLSGPTDVLRIHNGITATKTYWYKVLVWE